MVSLIAFALFTTTTFEATDDVWVYEHAQDQTSDEFVRVWGSGGVAVEAPGSGGASWSMLKFDLSKLSTNEIKSAKLVLTSFGDVAFLKSDSVKGPIQVRPCPATFEEENFSFAKAADFMPNRDDKSIFGTAVVDPRVDQKDFVVEVDLLAGKGDFKKAVSTALQSPNKLLGLALTSTLDPQEAGDGGIYKFYSRNTKDAQKHPKLVIETAD